MPTSRRSLHPLAVPPALAILALAAPAHADDRYPSAVIARPLTLPSIVAVGADAGANNDFSSMTMSPIAAWGINDKLEVQVPYTFATREFEAKGAVGLDVGYVIVRGALDGKLEAIARARGGYDLNASAATPLMLGVHVQYNITPKIAVISGVPGSQQLRFAVEKNEAGARPIELALPIGVGVQPTDTVYLQLDTRLASIALKDGDTMFAAADPTPVALTAVWNVIPAIDVQAAVGSELTSSFGDALTFLVGARYYTGVK
jgi:hypothetical protein